jgi:hypothetical protein
LEDTQECSPMFLCWGTLEECVKMVQAGSLSLASPDGEIGRHSGLKIRRP